MEIKAMNSMRREVLKSIAAASVAIPAAASVPASAAGLHRTGAAASGTARVLPVIAGLPLDAAFVRGVITASERSAATVAPTQSIGKLDSAAIAALTVASDGRPTTIVGLTDSATAMLVLGHMRSKNATVVAMTHHRLAHEANAAAWAARIGELAVAQALSPAALLAGAADDGAAGAAYVPDGISYMSFTCVI
jgi:hypothetical protein